MQNPFLCNRILFAWEYHGESWYKKSFKFIMPMGFLLEADSLKLFQRGRGVCMYTTQVNSAFARADWLARWLAMNYSWLSSDVTKIQTPKSQGLLRFYLHLAKDLLKLNFCASFQRDDFASLLCVTLIWRPRRPSHLLKNNFIACFMPFEVWKY